MQEVFYDYKHTSYTVLDAVGQNDWQVYLLQNPATGDYYIFNTENAELKNSAKPLRSVFSRYKANEMYDIPKYAQQIQNEDLLTYERLKYDVIAYDVKKRQGIETSERIAHAKENGWQELNVENAAITLENDVLNILVDDKQFSVKARTSDIDFSTMGEEEINEFVSEWISTYNNTIGDLSYAQTNAEGKIISARKVAQWVGEGKNSSDFLTEKLVENLDICSKFDGYQGDRAFSMAQAILKHMSDNKIPFFSDPKLMGDCNGLNYDIYDVVRQHHIYNSECRAEEILSDLEIKTLHFLDSKGVLPLNAATLEERNYTATVDIPNSDDIELQAKKYTNKMIGAESYDIIVGSKYPYFDAGKRIIGCCSQQTLDIILGNKTPGQTRNVKLGATPPYASPEESGAKPTPQSQEQM